MDLDYDLTLISIKIKNRQQTQLVVTNKRNNIRLTPNNLDDTFVFNEHLIFREGRMQKHHIELLVNLISKTGVVFIGGPSCSTDSNSTLPKKLGNSNCISALIRRPLASSLSTAFIL